MFLHSRKCPFSNFNSPHIPEIHSRTRPLKKSHFSPSSPVQKGALPYFDLETEKISFHPATSEIFQKPGVFAEVSRKKSEQIQPKMQYNNK